MSSYFSRIMVFILSKKNITMQSRTSPLCLEKLLDGGS